MKLTHATAIAFGLLAAPAFADGHASGDPEAGEKALGKCKACHMVASEDETFFKGGKTGPNLYGLPGRTAGTDEGFKRYKKSIVALGETGFTWTEADFVAYVADPTKFLKEKLDDSKARSGMTFKLKSEEDALNIWAYIASVSPAPES
jgi:cytochrome c